MFLAFEFAICDELKQRENFFASQIADYCTFIQLSDNLLLTALNKECGEVFINEVLSGVSDMKRIQKWFDAVAGISQGEIERLARAREIFGNPQIDVSALKTPACWRRRARVQSFNS